MISIRPFAADADLNLRKDKVSLALNWVTFEYDLFFPKLPHEA